MNLTRFFIDDPGIVRGRVADICFFRRYERHQGL